MRPTLIGPSQVMAAFVHPVTEFWIPQLFLAELDNLLGALGVQGGYHLLGQSWGGMLGAEHAVTAPPGLRSLVIADSPASMELWSAAAAGLRAQLPAEVEKVLPPSPRSTPTRRCT